MVVRGGGHSVRGREFAQIRQLKNMALISQMSPNLHTRWEPPEGAELPSFEKALLVSRGL